MTRADSPFGTIPAAKISTDAVNIKPSTIFQFGISPITGMYELHITADDDSPTVLQYDFDLAPESIDIDPTQMVSASQFLSDEDSIEERITFGVRDALIASIQRVEFVYDNPTGWKNKKIECLVRTYKRMLGVHIPFDTGILGFLSVKE